MRTTFRIQYSQTLKQWVCRVSRQTIATDDRKGWLLARCVQGCRMLLEAGVHSQIVIHARHGRIQSERTYGADPKRRKG